MDNALGCCKRTAGREIEYDKYSIMFLQRFNCTDFYIYIYSLLVFIKNSVLSCVQLKYKKIPDIWHLKDVAICYEFNNSDCLLSVRRTSRVTSRV